MSGRAGIARPRSASHTSRIRILDRHATGMRDQAELGRSARTISRREVPATASRAAPSSRSWIAICGQVRRRALLGAEPRGAWASASGASRGELQVALVDAPRVRQIDPAHARTPRSLDHARQHLGPRHREHELDGELRRRLGRCDREAQGDRRCRRRRRPRPCRRAPPTMPSADASSRPRHRAPRADARRGGPRSRTVPSATARRARRVGGSRAHLTAVGCAMAFFQEPPRLGNQFDDDPHAAVVDRALRPRGRAASCARSASSRSSTTASSSLDREQRAGAHAVGRVGQSHRSDRGLAAVARGAGARGASTAWSPPAYEPRLRRALAHASVRARLPARPVARRLLVPARDDRRRRAHAARERQPRR